MRAREDTPKYPASGTTNRSQGGNRFVLVLLFLQLPFSSSCPRSSLSSPFSLIVSEALSPSKNQHVCAPFLLQIVDAVHDDGSFISLQLWALERAAIPDVLQKEGDHPLVAPSAIPLPTKTNDDSTRFASATFARVDGKRKFEEYVRLYATAAEKMPSFELGSTSAWRSTSRTGNPPPDQFLQTDAVDGLA